MEAGAIQNENGMGAWRNLATDALEVQRDRLGIEPRQDEGGSRAASRTYRAQNIGPGEPLIENRRPSQTRRMRGGLKESDSALSGLPA